MLFRSDTNRTIGQPNKITVIFGRKVTKRYRGKLQTVIEDMDLPNPVIRSHYGNGFVKQYVRDHLLLRTEPASNNIHDYGCNKAIENLPRLRESMSSVIDNYLNVQQDILETFIDRGQLRKLAQPHDPAEGLADSRPETGSSSPVGSDACLGPFLPYCCAEHLFDGGDLHPYTGSPGDFSQGIQLGISPLRSVETPSQGTG